jgi:hypothetical protein
MLHQVEHVARISRHTTGSHCNSSSTFCSTSGESSESHRLCPAARAASTASALSFSCAASLNLSLSRAASARARSSATRQSSIVGFAPARRVWVTSDHSTVSAAADQVLGARLTAVQPHPHLSLRCNPRLV